MTEKDNVSMATVQMKTDYAASEVYSTASEPPPVSTRGGVRGTLKTLSGFTDFHHACILSTLNGATNCALAMPIARLQFPYVDSQNLSGNYLRYLKQVVASYLQAMWIENKMPGSLLSWPAHPLWLAHSAYAQWAMSNVRLAACLHLSWLQLQTWSFSPSNCMHKQFGCG